MEKLILLYFTTISSFATPFLHMSENELKIALELTKKHQIDHCIFIKYEIKDNKLISYVKKFSKVFIPTTFFTPSEVDYFMWLASYRVYSETTAFIFKESNTTGIENLFYSIFVEVSN